VKPLRNPSPLPHPARWVAQALHPSHPLPRPRGEQKPVGGLVQVAEAHGDGEHEEQAGVAGGEEQDGVGAEEAGD